jgi:hypothetical protein
MPVSVSPAPTPESASEISKIARPGAIYGLRLRAILVGLPLVCGLSLVSVYADMVAQNIQFGVLQLAPPAVAALFVLALANRWLSKLLKREFLSRADILIIYSMLLVTVMVSTRGAIERIIPPLAHLPYYATSENKLHEQITQYIPAWALPFSPTQLMRPDYMADFYEGGPIPWVKWVGPLVAWFGLYACSVLVFASMASILRRQWMDNEQLRFPLTTLPLAIIQDEVEGQPFFSNRLMWLGCAFAFTVFGVNGLAANFPDWPKFVLDLWLSAWFTERPWNGMDIMAIYISLAAIGFAYFLPTDLLFSLWFFFLLTRFQDVFAVQLGGIPTGIGTHNARVWTGYQSAGAYFTLALVQFRIGWPYFKQVWKTAFGPADKKPLDDSTELMSYRAALIGLIGGFAGIILWLTLAGMSPVVALVYMGIYLFVVAFIMSRAVCEAGLLMTETSFLPNHLMGLVYRVPDLGANNLAIMSLLHLVFARDLRGMLLTPLLDNQKMAGELRVKQRSMLLPFGLAVLVAFVAASYFMLKFSYDKGHLTLYGYPSGNAGNMFRYEQANISGTTQPPDSTAYAGFGVGVVVTLFLSYMRANFTWFPLHPLAYAIDANWAIFVFWFPFFIAWIIKSLVLRFGGIDTFRRIAPFMLGLILGEFMSAVFWSTMKMTRDWSTPSFPWP